MANPVSLKKIAAALVVAGMAAGTAQAASVPGGAHASATVVTPISVAETQAMSFGTVVADPASASTITLTTSTAGGATLTPTGAAYAVGVGAVPGTLTVTGEPNRTYSLSSVAGTTITLNGTIIGNTITVTNLQAFQANTTPSQLDATGHEVIYIGGTLNLGAAQASDTYSGTYNVTVNY